MVRFRRERAVRIANIILFDAEARAALVRNLGLTEDTAEPALLECIQARWPSWFEVKSFALRAGIAFGSEVDFMP
jgi:hypothetical protein